MQRLLRRPAAVAAVAAAALLLPVAPARAAAGTAAAGRVPTPPSPAVAARAQLERLAPALGSADGDLVTRDVGSLVGGRTLVRTAQVIDGVPVFGGEQTAVVDASGDLQAVSGATASAPARMAWPLPAAAAGRAAVAEVARRAARPPGSDTAASGAAGLAVASTGRTVFDPALAGRSGTSRAAWQVEVRDTAAGTRSAQVVVDAADGAVLLVNPRVRYALDRVVCDLHGQGMDAAQLAADLCRSANASRREGSAAAGVADVDTAFDNLGVTAAYYRQVLGVDLTALIGSQSGSEAARRLRAMVNVCQPDEVADCTTQTWANAYWDGTGIVLGSGMGRAVDVVSHELTHGVTDATAGLVYDGESGAIDESLSDTLGELAERWSAERAGRAGTDPSWLIGEDLPAGVGPVRNMSAPATLLYGTRQPDRMASPYWQTGTADFHGVHANSGVGNRAAWLVGRSLGVVKTSRLYWDALRQLTPFATYATLGALLRGSCLSLAAAGAAGFGAADCAAVDAAVTATQMTQRSVRLALSAPSVAYGSAVRLAATVTDARGRAVRGTPVVLAGRTSSLRPYAALGTGTTTAGGQVVWTALRPAATTTYAVTAPARAPWSAAGGAVTVQVRAVVSATGPASARRGAVVRYTGGAYPTRPGAAVQLQRYAGGAWTVVATARLDARSRYSVAWRPASAGAAVLRVVRPGESLVLPGASRTLHLRVA